MRPLKRMDEDKNFKCKSSAKKQRERKRRKNADEAKTCRKLDILFNSTASQNTSSTSQESANKLITVVSIPKYYWIC